MIDQLIMCFGDEEFLIMLTQTTIFMAKGVSLDGGFAFDPTKRLEIRPVSWSTAKLFPLINHQQELHQLYNLHKSLGKPAKLEEAN